MGVTFGPGMVRALEERLAEVTAERDRLRAEVADLTAERDHLRAAIEAIPRHEAHDCGRACPCANKCSADWFDWPCPTERAHRAAEATRHGPDCLAGCCDGAKPPCGPCTCGHDEATP